MLELLTESRCQVARRCMREERFRYVDGYQPVSTSDALRFGTLWHHGMEAWWLSERDAQYRLGIALDALRAHATPDTDVYELARAEAMTEGYEARWCDERFDVIAVEKEFRAPLINPETGAPSRTFQRAGKIDALAKNASGSTLVIEHKTSGSDIAPGSAWWARLRFGGQSAGYLRGAEALGCYAEGVLYDVARKPMLRPLQANAKRAAQESVDEYRDRVRADIAENPDKYFQRGLVVRLDNQMEEADAELWQLASVLREHHRLQLAPRNPDACERYGQTCSFFGVCAGEESIDDPALFKRLPFVHSELSNG